MNRVVQFDEATFSDLRDCKLAHFLVEFDDRGHVQREIGIGIDGRVAHRFPGHPTLDEYGMMGPNVIAIAGEQPSSTAILMEACALVPLDVFEDLWLSS